MSRKDQSRKYYIGRSDKALAVGAILVRVRERDQASSTHTKRINPDKRDLIINNRKSHFLAIVTCKADKSGGGAI